MKKFQIQQFDLNGNLIATYNNGQEAATAVGCSKMAISYNINGKSTQCAGYIFKKVSLETTNLCEAAPSFITEEITANAIKLYDTLIGYAITLTHNGEDAKELVQDAYLRFFEKAEYDPKKGALLQWFHGVINKSFYYKFDSPKFKADCYLEDQIHSTAFKHDTKGLTIGGSLAASETTIEDIVERERLLDDRRKILMDELDARCFSITRKGFGQKQKDDYKRVLELYFDGYTVKEMAEVLGLTEGSMAYKLVTVRKFVCQQLGISLKSFTRYNFQSLDQAA